MSQAASQNIMRNQGIPQLHQRSINKVEPQAIRLNAVRSADATFEGMASLVPQITSPTATDVSFVELTSNDFEKRLQNRASRFGGASIPSIGLGTKLESDGVPPAVNSVKRLVPVKEQKVKQHIPIVKQPLVVKQPAVAVKQPVVVKQLSTHTGQSKPSNQTTKGRSVKKT